MSTQTKSNAPVLPDAQRASVNANGTRTPPYYKAGVVGCGLILLIVEHEVHEAQNVWGDFFAIPGSNAENYAMRFREHIARAEEQFSAFQRLVPNLADPSGLQSSYLNLFESWRRLCEQSFARV